MFCWKCGESFELEGRVSFRETCPKCDIDIHTCKGCRFYQIGKPNDCLIPGTEYVRDREKNNYCEDFKPIENIVKDEKVSSSDIAKKLFKDASDDENDKKSFDSLFK